MAYSPGIISKSKDRGQRQNLCAVFDGTPFSAFKRSFTLSRIGRGPTTVRVPLSVFVTPVNLGFRMHVGFAALREFIQLRPPVRNEALRILLDLTAHSGLSLLDCTVSAQTLIHLTEKVTRNAAINTVRRWVPDVEPMNGAITAFAKKLLKRLEIHKSEDGTMEETPEEDIPRYLPPKLELPAKKSEVIQHVELMFALSVRVPTFLDE